MKYHHNRSSSSKKNVELDFASDQTADRVLKFHKSLPNYQATPTQELTALASHLGVASIRVKDESKRFDLNAFKVLGASYAIASLLHEWLGLSSDEFSFEGISAQQKRYKHLTLVTATDGNHGRAVAWVAQKFGCKAHVYMPHGTLEARAKAIQGYGARAEITDLSYDDTVKLAAQTATEPDSFLVQDTAWDEYTQIPLIIQQGYFSLLSEAFEQLKSDQWPSHVFVQAGVGSLPAALAARLQVMSKGTDKMPDFIVVEPTMANCLYQSMAGNNGDSISLDGHLPTIMAGLACGTPSSIALRVLADCASGFLCCDDEVAKRGMRVMGNPLGEDPPITSGESGAVTLGALYELCNNPANAAVREQMGLNAQSQVLLFSTEGDTAPELYRDIVWGN